MAKRCGGGVIAESSRIKQEGAKEGEAAVSQSEPLDFLCVRELEVMFRSIEAIRLSTRLDQHC